MKKVEELTPEIFDECPRFLSLQRFAYLTGLSDRLDILYDWIQSGDLPLHKFGNQRLIDMKCLQNRIRKSQLNSEKNK